MALENQLLQYGTLGLWTIFNIFLIMYFLRKREQTSEKLIKVIENNTIFLTRNYEFIKYYNRK